MTFENWWAQYLKKEGNEMLTEYEMDVARDAWNSQQARIDRLMLEHCPEEMTIEQRAEWAKNQRTFSK